MDGEELGLQERVPLHEHSFALFCLLYSGVGGWMGKVYGHVLVCAGTDMCAHR